MRLAIAPLLNVQAQSKPDKTKKDIQITWLGHAAFEIVSSGGTKILIDPFLRTTLLCPPYQLKQRGRA